MALRFTQTHAPLALLSCAALVTSACGDNDPAFGPDTAENVDVIGDYDDGYGGFVRVAETFVSYSWYGEDIAISAHDNDGGWIVGQNSADDPWSPNLWSRMEWIETNDAVLWCQTEFAAETEEAALAGASADRENTETGCSGFPWTVLTPGQGTIAVAGEYDDGADGFVRVDNTGVWFAWHGAANVAVTEYDNSGEWAIGQNSADDPWNPNLWSKVEWALSDDGFHWCQTGFGEADEDAARALEAADRSDWETGCSGFPWSRITIGQGPIAIAGAWADGWGGEHTIDSGSWLQTYPESPAIAFEIAGFSNPDSAAFAMNSEDNEFFGGDWSRLDWTRVDGALWYCQAVFDGVDEEAVRAAEPADASDPASSGCGAAPWTELTAGEAE